MDERIKAVIDADFFLKLTIYEKGTALFMRMMAELIATFLNRDGYLVEISSASSL